MAGEETIAIEEQAPAAAPTGRRRSNARWIAILLFLAFAGGVAATIWAMPALTAWWRGARPPSAANIAALPPGQPVVANAFRPASLARQELLDAHMAELEDRMARITIDAQAASGHAARAEGLLIAFAARRALDSGSPLGYVEGQLRSRFGQAQPRAVATIINAAREPVTLTDLEAGFEDIAPGLRTDPPGTGWWTAFMNEARDLVIIRKATTPSRVPEQAVPRIRRLLESGRIDPAITEVERLPGHAKADRWLQTARRYREARRALDLIETAAILEAPQIRAQPSQLAP